MPLIEVTKYETLINLYRSIVLHLSECCTYQVLLYTCIVTSDEEYIIATNISEFAAGCVILLHSTNWILFAVTTVNFRADSVEVFHLICHTKQSNQNSSLSDGSVQRLPLSTARRQKIRQSARTIQSQRTNLV